jgi:hypothetical protein
MQRWHKVIEPPGRSGRAGFIAVLASLLCAVPGYAGFIGEYSIANFECVNTDAGGTCVTPDGGASVIVTGGDTGSLAPGSTWLQMPAPASLLISFDYLFVSGDLLDDPQLPIFDIGGYVSAGQFQPLSLASLMGSFQFQVNKGDLFGFGVETVDNMGGAGVLSISNFQARDSQSSPIPEPGSAQAIAIAIAGVAAGNFLRARRKRGNNK